MTSRWRVQVGCKSKWHSDRNFNTLNMELLLGVLIYTRLGTHCSSIMDAVRHRISLSAVSFIRNMIFWRARLCVNRGINDQVCAPTQWLVPPPRSVTRLVWCWEILSLIILEYHIILPFEYRISNHSHWRFSCGISCALKLSFLYWVKFSLVNSVFFCEMDRYNEMLPKNNTVNNNNNAERYELQRFSANS